MNKPDMRWPEINDPGWLVKAWRGTSEPIRVIINLCVLLCALLCLGYYITVFFGDAFGIIFGIGMLLICITVAVAND